MNVSEVSDFLGSLEPFSQLNRDQVQMIAMKIKVAYCAAGNCPTVGEGRILLLRTGAISLLDDRDDVIDILQAGDFHGIGAAFDNCQEHYYLRCVEDSLIYSFAQDDFRLLLEQYIALREFFHQMKEQNLYKQQKRISRVNTARVGDIIQRRVISVDPQCDIQGAVELMTDLSISSLLIEEDRKPLGILTDKDLRRRVIAERLDYKTPVSEVMTKDPWTVSVDSLLLNALEIMCRRNIHHLPVMDRDGELTGMVSSTDLMNRLQTDPVSMISKIHRQNAVEGLVAISRQLPDLVDFVAQTKLPSFIGSQIITSITDALTQRLIEIHIATHGAPPCLFSWVAFGSQARNEQALNADQDNALVIEREPGGSVGIYFEYLAQTVCDGLDACGIPYCKGGIMAKNKDHRLSLRSWKQLFEGLLSSPTPSAVMRASIYFDARCIYGSNSLFNGLRKDTLAMTSRNELFLYHLADDATKVKAPIGLFKNLILDKKQNKDKGLDLKERGLILITDLVRVYTLNAGFEEVNTRERLLLLKSTENGSSSLGPNECEDLLGAFDFLAQLRWDKHYTDLLNKKPPNNLVDPRLLSAFQRQQLKDVFSVVNRAQQNMRHRFCRDTW